MSTITDEQLNNLMRCIQDMRKGVIHRDISLINNIIGVIPSHLTKTEKSTSMEIFCKLQVEGIHYWENCDILEVEYLLHPHRHNFFITAYIDVTHSDRDIEFIKLKHQILEYLSEQYWVYNSRLHDFGGKSCEMIAHELLKEFNLTKVEVSEDNECGAIVIANS